MCLGTPSGWTSLWQRSGSCNLAAPLLTRPLNHCSTSAGGTGRSAALATVAAGSALRRRTPPGIVLGSTRSMRIAMISTPFVAVPPRTYGGTELVVAELVEGLVERGHEVTLFATGDSRTS